MVKRYTQLDKDFMRLAYNNGQSIRQIAKHFGCSYSTVFYAINPEAYEKHKLHAYYMRRLKKGGH